MPVLPKYPAQIKKDGASEQVLQLNPDAALQRAVTVYNNKRGTQYQVVSGEYDVLTQDFMGADVIVRCQKIEDLEGAQPLYVGAILDQWDTVYVTDGLRDFMPIMEWDNPSPEVPTSLLVVHLPSSHFSSRQGQTVEYGIIHSTASPKGSTVQSTAKYLQHNDRGVSIHEFVSADTAYVMVSDIVAAHHCESPTANIPNTPNNLNNEVTWGIEAFQLAGEEISPEVEKALFARVVKKAKELRIPAENWLGHYEIDPKRRQDPVGINMVLFRAKLAKALAF